MQLELPLTHEFKVEVAVTVRFSVFAPDTRAARSMAEAVMAHNKIEGRIDSIIRADLNAEDVLRDPKIATKSAGKPLGKPAPPGGTPGTPVVPKYQKTNAVSA